MNTKWVELNNPLVLFSSNGDAFVLSFPNTEFYNHTTRTAANMGIYKSGADELL